MSFHTIGSIMFSEWISLLEYRLRYFWTISSLGGLIVISFFHCLLFMPSLLMNSELNLAPPRYRSFFVIPSPFLIKTKSFLLSWRHSTPRIPCLLRILIFFNTCSGILDLIAIPALSMSFSSYPQTAPPL